MIIIIPLSVLLTGILYMSLIAIATQIDGGAAVANAASANVQGIFIIFFVINLLPVLIATIFGYYANSKNKKKMIAVTNILSIAYKAIILSIYGFIWGAFMCIPALATGGLLGIIGQAVNFLGSLIVPLVHLIIQLLMWIPAILIEAFAARKFASEKTILNLVIRIIGCALCTYLVSKWLYGHSIPYLLDVSNPELIEHIYGKEIFNTLETMGFITQ